MQHVLSPDEMRRADERAIAGGVSAEILMDRAGRAVARAAIALAGGRYGKRALVLCGKGNNGGDGFVAARELARAGMAVTCLTTSTDEPSGAARHHLELMVRAGVKPRPFQPGSIATRHVDVIVDAIFGTGFHGRLQGSAAAAIDAVNASGVPVVAVDIPSGVDGGTGEIQGVAIRASLTVTFAARKIGTVLMPGRAYTGEVIVADIGIEPDIDRPDDPSDGGLPHPYVELVEPADVAAQRWAREAGAHKLTSGAVAILAGSDDIIGAALLTARGALRAGSGYVILGSTRAVMDAAAVATPEVVCHVVTDGATLGGDALDAFKPALERAAVVAVGSGLGRGRTQAELVRRVLDEIDVPVVLDADALNALDGDLGPVARRSAPTVLTPHAGELARLLSLSRDQVEGDRLGSAVRACHTAGKAVVVAKGHPTLIAGDGGRQVWIVDSGGSELATAGTGDVLTGVVAARLTAVPDPVAAAIGAVYLHGLAGRLEAATRGDLGLAALDVAETMPHAIAEIEAGLLR